MVEDACKEGAKIEYRTRGAWSGYGWDPNPEPDWDWTYIEYRIVEE